ncbi:uncharacterized protein [Diadema setosum]|uniref:uncharacterized protein n=1 Tax=Diadema setosum TaxID=31175 RepID=UPI003B3AD24C
MGCAPSEYHGSITNTEDNVWKALKLVSKSDGHWPPFKRKHSKETAAAQALELSIDPVPNPDNYISHVSTEVFPPSSELDFLIVDPVSYVVRPPFGHLGSLYSVASVQITSAGYDRPTSTTQLRRDRTCFSLPNLDFRASYDESEPSSVITNSRSPVAESSAQPRQSSCSQTVVDDVGKDHDNPLKKLAELNRLASDALADVFQLHQTVDAMMEKS